MKRSVASALASGISFRSVRLNVLTVTYSAKTGSSSMMFALEEEDIERSLVIEDVKSMVLASRLLRVKHDFDINTAFLGARARFSC